MRVLEQSEINRVHGGGDGIWYPVGSHGERLGADLDAGTVRYQTRHVLYGGYSYFLTATHNFNTDANTLGVTATNGGRTYSFTGGDGYTFNFDDSHNGNDVHVIVEFGPGGDFEMLQLQFTHELDHQPKATRGRGALTAHAPSVM